MKYTLFVDESGDFGESNRTTPWVVGGVLCPLSFKDAERKIGNRLNPIPSQHGLSGRGEMHRTELNQKVHDSRSDWSYERIRDLTIDLFDGVLAVAPKSKFVAVHSADGRGLDDAEDTYRVMLVDLIAAADAMLPAYEEIDELDLCIATRTKQGKAMSSRNDLANSIKSIRSQIEIDLASQGLMGVISQKQFKHIQQKRSWLLTIADFWCNTVYNKNSRESAEVVERVARQRVGRVFNSGKGDRRERRAYIAERDGNWGLALFRWSIIDIEQQKAPDAAAHGLRRVFREILRDDQERSARPILEIAIELLWSNYGEKERYDAFIHALTRLVEAISTVAEELKSVDVSVMIFRLRYMIQLAANRDGQTAKANTVAEKQRQSLPKVASDPANIPLLLDVKLAEIHSLHHALTFDTALEAATEHREMVQTYAEMWQLITDDYGLHMEAFPRMRLKSEMTWLQSKIYNAGLGESLGDVLTRIEEVGAFEMAAYDRARLCNLHIVARIKQGWYRGALEKASAALEDAKDRFTLAYAQRAAVVALLSGDGEVDTSLVPDISEHVEKKALPDAQGVMHSLIWRDLSLAEMLLHKNKKRALQKLKRAKAALPWYGQATSSPIRISVAWTLDLAEAFIKGGEDSSQDIPDAIQSLFAPDKEIRGRAGLNRAWRILPY